MKYIRTKDAKIIKILKEGTDEFGKYGMVDEENCIRNYDNLKQADTIEELCDEFVLAKNDYFEYTIFRLFTTAKSLKLESVKNKEVVANIYGAIWTDKGLIYVAKMNDKGELELL